MRADEDTHGANANITLLDLHDGSVKFAREPRGKHFLLSLLGHSAV